MLQDINLFILGVFNSAMILAVAATPVPVQTLIHHLSKPTVVHHRKIWNDFSWTTR